MATSASSKSANGSVHITVLGLGEAGSLIAADLVAAGAAVVVFDPADVPTPEGAERGPDAGTSVKNADLVLAVTPPARAPAALADALDSLGAGTVYADLSTGSPKMKRGLALTAERKNVLFADVALLSSIPGVGLRARALASGSGAERYVAVMDPLGADVTDCGPEAGRAASRKYLRAVMLRGFGTVAVEALNAGHAADDVEWLWANMNDEINAGGDNWLAETVARLGPFARRRRREMDSCALYFDELDLDPVMTRSTLEMLRRIEADGLPTIPAPPD